MAVLLTNDDGIHAPGLWALYEALSIRHEVVVVAPEVEQSATGHGLTLYDPLRVKPIHMGNGFRGHAVSGKPVDCVKLALGELLEALPVMVISGINPGVNLGVNLHYSGTVAAAREGAIHGIPAMAVSIQAPGKHMAEAARFAADLADRMLHQGLPAGTLLNVNLPDRPLDRIRGIAISRQDTTRPEKKAYEKRLDPRQRSYYWLEAEFPRPGRDTGVDVDAVDQEFISITPVKCDMTDHETLAALRGWDIRVPGATGDGA